MSLGRVGTLASLCLVFGMTSAALGQEVKLSDCPAAVRKTFEAEAKGSKIETVHTEKEDAETVYWAEVTIGGRFYAIGVLEDGTLTEMNLAVADDELAFEKCSAPVQTTFRREAFGETPTEVGKDIKYGVTIFATVVKHKGKAYQIVVAEDGTLVEKVLVIEDDEVELTKCPATVQAALKEHARGGTIGAVTRSTGLGRPTFEAEVMIRDKVYLIEVAENGHLLSKSLEAAEE